MATGPLIVALQALGYLVLLPLLWQGGNRFSRLFLQASGSLPSPPTKLQLRVKAGRFIGILERSLIVIGIVMGSWEVILAVIAIKTVGRYQELDDKDAAEYFLVGSLASILWAVVVAGLLAAYDDSWGFHWIASIRHMLKS
jgi:hypothetical protein